MTLQIKSIPCRKLEAIEENDVKDEIEIVLSSVIHRDDQDVEDEIN